MLSEPILNESTKEGNIKCGISVKNLNFTGIIIIISVIDHRLIHNNFLILLYLFLLLFDEHGSNTLCFILIVIELIEGEIILLELLI